MDIENELYYKDYNMKRNRAEEKKAYEEGYKAFFEGKQLYIDNPHHLKGTETEQQWDDGWWDAMGKK